MIAPTWCMSKKLYDKVGGFHETEPVGFPEDLCFFYDALKIGADFIKVLDFQHIRSLFAKLSRSVGVI